MAATERPSRPHAVLFACGMNAVRSPMAAALMRQMFGTTSMSVRPACRRASSIPLRSRRWRRSASTSPGTSRSTFEELEDLEGLNFDLIVTLSPPRASQGDGTDPHAFAAEVEYWPTADPTGTEGNREQRLDAYRAVRDQLTAHIRERFGGRAAGMNDAACRSVVNRGLFR